MQSKTTSRALDVKRLALAVFLSGVLAFGQIPVIAYADESNQDASASFEQGNSLDDDARSNEAESTGEEASPVEGDAVAGGESSTSGEVEGDSENGGSSCGAQEGQACEGASDEVEQGVEPSGSAKKADERDRNERTDAQDAVVEQSPEADDGLGEDEQGAPESLALLMSASPRDAESDRIHSSVESLAEGTYTVSANVSMMTPIPGVRGYTTNPLNPESIGGAGGIPNMPKTNNATLVVDSDGSCVLTVDLVNPVFTIQQVGDGSTITVLDYETSPIEQKDGDEEYNQGLANAGISTRISQLTLQLKDLSGVYVLENCKEYATTLGTSDPDNGRLSNDLDVDVDLANAVRHIEGDYEKTFTDESTGVSVRVAAEEGSDLIPVLETAQLSVGKIESGSAYESVKASLAQKYRESPAFALYSVQLVANGEAVSFEGGAEVRVGIPASADGSKAFSFDGAILGDLDVSFQDGALSFDVSKLGYFVLVDAGQSVEEWAWSYVSSDLSTGVSFGYATDGKFDGVIMGGTEDQGAMYLDWYKDYFAYYYSDAADSSATQSALDLIGELEDIENPAISGMYSAGWSIELMMGAPVTPFGDNYSFLSERNPAWMSVPISSGSSVVYYAYGTVGSGITSVKKIDASFEQNRALVYLTKESTGFENPVLPLFNAASGAEGNTGGPQSETTPIGYIVVADEAPQPIEKPLAASDLVYNGQEQTGVEQGEGYDLTGEASAVDAGTYTVLATPKDGYVWADGGSETVPLQYTIEKAELTAAYAGEEISENRKPALEVLVSGFVNGETAETAKDYVAPTVSAPERIEEGREYELVPEGGSAANYSFSYLPGLLKVTKAEKLTPGTYAITANLSMPGEYNPLIAGLTVYANSPDNPFGKYDENDPAEVGGGVPSSPKSMNATLVVGEDGTRTLVLPIKNPVFTTQDLGVCEELSNVQVEWTTPYSLDEYPTGRYAPDGAGADDGYPGRIHKM